MDTKDAYIEQLENTIKNLQDQVSNLTEMRNRTEIHHSSCRKSSPVLMIKVAQTLDFTGFLAFFMV